MKFILIGLFITVSSFKAVADEYYKMSKVTCAPEIGLFEITSTGVANINEYYEIDHDMSKVFDEISSKYGLFVGGSTTHTCTVNGKKVKAVIEYRKSSSRGMCGGNPGAKLNVFIDDEKVVLNMPFQEDCDSASAYSLKIDKYNVWVCGGRSVPSHCVWKDIISANRDKAPITSRDLGEAIYGE